MKTLLKILTIPILVGTLLISLPDAAAAPKAVVLVPSTTTVATTSTSVKELSPPPQKSKRKSSTKTTSPHPSQPQSNGTILWTKNWMDLHNCEQPGNWYADGYNKADPAHQRFQGGLGMSTKAWQMAVKAAALRGVTLPDSALSSSPEQQMTGAQAFYDKYGWGWACHV